MMKKTVQDIKTARYHYSVFLGILIYAFLIIPFLVWIILSSLQSKSVKAQEISELRELATTLISESHNFRQADSDKQQIIMPKIEETAKKRKEKILEIIKTDPKQFLNNVISEADYNLIPEQYRPLVEQKVEKEGRYFSVYYDNFEQKKGWQEHFIQVDSAKIQIHPVDTKYQYKPLQTLHISGYLLDNHLVYSEDFDSQNPSSLKKSEEQTFFSPIKKLAGNLATFSQSIFNKLKIEPALAVGSCGDDCWEVGWSRPTGHVEASGFLVGSKNCSSTGTSCNIIFNDGDGNNSETDTVGYTVYHQGTTGSIIKTGTKNVTEGISATFSWSWPYKVIWCNTGTSTDSSCYGNPTVQSHGLANSTLSSPAYSITGLTPGDRYAYQVEVEGQDGSGNDEIKNGNFLVPAIASSPSPSATPAPIFPQPASNLTIDSQVCRDGFLEIQFGWNLADPVGGTLQEQILEFSVFNNNFLTGTYQSRNLGNYGTEHTENGFVGELTYYWRINSIINFVSFPSATQSFTTDRCLRTIGEQKTAVFLINFQDYTAEVTTPGQVREVLLTDPVDSVDKWFREVSYNRAYLTGDVYGYYTLNINKTCDLNLMEQFTIQAADGDIDFTNVERIVLLMGNDLACPWLGVGVNDHTISTNDGNIIASLSILYDSFYWLRALYEHEMGHSLGLGHSEALDCDILVYREPCTVIPYGDPFDVMGNGSLGQSGHYNSFAKELIGWLEPSNIQTVNADGNFNVGVMESTANDIKLLKIPHPIPGLFYIIEYRQPIGYDRPFAGNGHQGALIRLGPNNTFPYLNANLIDNHPESHISDEYIDFHDAALDVGRVFTDSAGNTIHVTGRSSTSLNLRIRLNPGNSDEDGDGISNLSDNCSTVANPLQQNSDSGPRQSLKAPKAGINDSGTIDNGISILAEDVTIANGDITGDACDVDDDNDLLLDIDEAVLANCGSFNGISANHPNPQGSDITNDDNRNGNPAAPMGTDTADNGPSWDTDGDGVLDGYECLNGANPRNISSVPPLTINDTFIDDDGDGLMNGWERRGWGTNIWLVDTDLDGIGDCKEAADTNGDGLVLFSMDGISAVKAVLTTTFGKTMDFDINRDAVLLYTLDALQIVKISLGTVPCL